MLYDSKLSSTLILTWDSEGNMKCKDSFMKRFFVAKIITLKLLLQRVQIAIILGAMIELPSAIRTGKFMEKRSALT